MRCRWRERLLAVLQGESQRMLDLSAGNFVVASQTGEHWQTGRIGGSPGVGALLIVEQIPDRGGCCFPATILLRIRAVHLIEPAIIAVEHQNMPVAIAGLGIALNRRV